MRIDPSTVGAAAYLLIALVGIIIAIEHVASKSEKADWPLFRRHRFRRLDLDIAILFGFVMLLFDASMHSLTIARVNKPAWLDVAGTSVILLAALAYVVHKTQAPSWRSVYRRGWVFFSPIFVAMSIDQYLAKAAAMLSRVL